MKKSARNSVIASLAVLLALAAAAGFIVGRKYVDRKLPNFSGGMEIYVYPKMNALDIVEELVDSGIVIRPRSLERAFREEGLLPISPEASRIQPGHYTISTSNTSTYVARMLKGGWQTPVNLVISGAIRKRGDLARKISRQMLLDSADVMAALKDSALLAGYGFTPENVFGLIIPDTYEVYWTDSMRTVLDKNKAALDAFWTEENRAKA